MRWPWESRTVADLIERRRVGEVVHYEREIADLHEQLRVSEARYAELFGSFKEIVVPKVPTVVTRPDMERPKSVVSEAIRNESGGDPRLAGYFRKRALELKAEGKSPEEIAELIGSWETADTEARD